MTFDPYAEARAQLQLQRAVEPTQRSGAPKVIGVLAIIFASLGLLCATLPVGLQDDLRRHHTSWSDLGAYGTWVMVWVLLTLAISGVHLAGGIQAVRYRASGPRLLTIYGIAALVLLVADVGLSLLTFPGSWSSVKFDAFVGPRLGLDFLSVAWPIVALAVINTKRSRQSCH
jgi:hypothetical protein